MSMDAELYARVRKLEKQVEALLARLPEVRSALERELSRTLAYSSVGSLDANPVRTDGGGERNAS